MIRIGHGLVLAFALAVPALAADDPCDKFAWPLSRERQQFAAVEKMAAKAGDGLPSLPRTALVLHLLPAGDVRFIMPPERTPKAQHWFGGTLSLPAPARPGVFQVTLSHEAWIDLVQDGRYAHSVGSTGRSDCTGVRKSVRFDLAAAPSVLQLSGVSSNVISLVIAAAP
jgi:hypothetical protein